MHNSSTFAIPSAGYSVTVTVKIPNIIGKFALLLSKVAELGGSIAEVELVSSDFESTIRKITINAKSTESAEEIVKHFSKFDFVQILTWQDDTLKMHEGGKLTTQPKLKIRNSDELSRAYTPGVARVCQLIHEFPEKSYQYTIKNDCVAVITDGTAVLGLGDIGPAAAMPVMEGKAVLFKEFAGVNSFPICLDTKDTEEIIKTIIYLAPTFGAINLEDISAPRCFEIEERLIEALDIPVFHDDQHGTAVVVLAGVYNALKVLDRKLEDLKIVVNGFGAGGVACIKILLEAGAKNIIACDTSGIAYRGRTKGMNSMKEELVKVTNPDNISGTLGDALVGADMFLGLSQPGVVTREMISTMNKNPLIFTLANPIPEIFPDEIADIAGVIATGRSDYPNQVNNVLCFPGIIKGAMLCRARKITMGMKLAAARAIADSIAPELLNKHLIIPNVFNPMVASKVTEAVMNQAKLDGVSRV